MDKHVKYDDRRKTGVNFCQLEEAEFQTRFKRTRNEHSFREEGFAYFWVRSLPNFQRPTRLVWVTKLQQVLHWQAMPTCPKQQILDMALQSSKSQNRDGFWPAGLCFVQFCCKKIPVFYLGIKPVCLRTQLWAKLQEWRLSNFLPLSSFQLIKSSYWLVVLS